MQTFVIRKDKVRLLRTRALIRLFAIVLIFVTTVVGLQIVAATTAVNPLGLAPFLDSFLGVFFAIVLYRGIRKSFATIRDFTVVLSNDQIIREKPTPMTIGYNEIREIIRTKRGGFVVRGPLKSINLWIPPEIDHYTDMESSLRKIKPLTNKRFVLQANDRTYLILVAIIAIGGVYAGFLTNKVLCLTCGIISIGLLAWGIYGADTLPPGKANRLKWGLGVLIGVVVLQVIQKLTRA
jgi:hypothetical protein